MEDLKVLEKDTYSILTITLISIIACIFLDISLFWGFLLSITFSIYKLVKIGFSLKFLKDIIIDGIRECKMLYILILLIGANISVWLSSGVVPSMMYYGFEYMNGVNFLFASFIITSIMSIFMGTAVGTISTIGIALIGVGKGFGLPAHILLGAIVSGAFIADKISPISGLLNLTLTTVKRSYKETIKSMFTTLIPTYIITGAIYYFIGNRYDLISNSSILDNYKSIISDSYFISPYLLVLPVLVLIMSVLGGKIIKCISVGLIGGVFFSLFFQHVSLLNIIDFILFGYKANTASGEINKILISGGVFSMIEVVSIVISAISLNSIFEGTSLIKPLVNSAVANIKSKGELVLKTGIISSILTIVTCDQTVGIIVPARMIKDKYEELEVDERILARTISDTGTIIAPLMPWNVNGLIILVISGISALKYAPYAIFCYICPVVSIIISYEFKWLRPEKNLLEQTK